MYNNIRVKKQVGHGNTGHLISLSTTPIRLTSSMKLVQTSTHSLVYINYIWRKEFGSIGNFPLMYIIAYHLWREELDFLNNFRPISYRCSNSIGNIENFFSTSFRSSCFCSFQVRTVFLLDWDVHKHFRCLLLFLYCQYPCFVGKCISASDDIGCPRSYYLPFTQNALHHCLVTHQTRCSKTA
jgi:hypothetical protein